MILKSIQLYKFRIYDELNLDVDDHFNVIQGLNGQGKTSLLEAISLLSNFRSFRNAKNSDLLKYENTEGRVFGKVEHQDLSYDLEVKIYPKRKTALLNHKSCKLLSEYVGKLASVSFSPSDLEIIQGSPENRRLWSDKVAQIFFPEHINVVTEYQKVVDQRNRLLKFLQERQMSSELKLELDVWSEKLCSLGAKITENRLLSLQKIKPEVHQNYEKISGSKNSLNIEYFRKDLEVLYGQNALKHDTNYTLKEIENDLKTALEKESKKELVLGSTLLGPHRDDLAFSLNGHEAKSFASQGETRSLLLAMRLSEAESLKRKNGYGPLLLIDDFSSELDAKRRMFLLDYLADSKSQVFLTTTEDLYIGKRYRVHLGKVFINDDATTIERQQK